MAPSKPKVTSKRGAKSRTKQARKKSSSRIRTGPISYSEMIERRERVIEIAGDEFIKHGFHGVSIDDIAERSRVSKKTIYQEHGDKKDLFREFFTSGMLKFRFNMEKAIHSERPLKDVVRDIVEFAVRGIDRRGSLALVRLSIAERTRFPQLANMVMAQANEIVRPLAAYFIQKSPTRKITQEEAERWAFHLMHMALGGAGSLLVEPDKFFGDREMWIESVTTLFLEGFPSE